jgi:hypothetical protein
MSQPQTVVTDKTSVLLASSLETVILLSNFSSIGHILSIVDTTLSSNLPSQPHIVSTIGGLTLYDGTSSILLREPGGNLLFSTRNTKKWQLINNTGFPNTLDRAFLENLTNTFSFFDTISTGINQVSSLNTFNLKVTENVTISGEILFKGGLTIDGVANFFSTVTTLGDTTLSGAFYIEDSAQFLSSVSVSDAILFYSNVDISGDFQTEGDLSLGSTLTLGGVLCLSSFFTPLENIHVQTLRVTDSGTSSRISGGMRIGGSFSTLSSLITTNARIQDSLYTSSLQTESINISTLTVKENIEFNHISTLSSVFLGGNLFIQGSLSVENFSSISTFIAQQNLSVPTISIDKNAIVSESTIVFQSTTVYDNATFSSLMIRSFFTILNGDLSISDKAYIKEISTTGGMFVETNLFVDSNFLLFGEMSTLSSIQITGSAQTLHISTQENAYIEQNILNAPVGIGGDFFTGFLDVENDLFVEKDLTVAGDFITNTAIASSNTQSIQTLTVFNTLDVMNDTLVSSVTTSSLYLESPFYLQIADTIVSQSNDWDIEGKLAAENLFLNELASEIGYFQTCEVGAVSVGDNLPDSNEFKSEVTSVFMSSVYTQTLSSVRITFSSITGNFGGDGSQLSNLNFDNLIDIFASSITVSSIVANHAYIQESEGGNLNSFKIQVNSNGFLSSINNFLVAGRAVFIEDVLQRSQNPFGDYFGTSNFFSNGADSIASSGNPNAPFYIAVGSNTNPLFSIQWSLNGTNWNPIQSGGFNQAGTKVTFGKGIWVACGIDTDPAKRIQYSLDGLNWSNGNFPPILENIVFNFGNDEWYLGARNLASNHDIWKSTDGINWSFVTPTNDRPTCFAYGVWETDQVFPSFFIPAWFVFQTTIPENEVRIGIIENDVLIANLSNRFPFSDGEIRDALYVPDATAPAATWFAVGKRFSGIYVSFDFGNNWGNINSGGFPGGEGGGFGLHYDTNTGIYFAVGESESSEETIQYSFNSLDWIDISGGGFSTGLRTPGFGSFIYLDQASRIIATGFNANSNGSNIQISFDSGTNFSNLAVQNSFGNNPVYGVTSIQVNSQEVVVAVGQGEVETRTIGFSLNAGTWFFPVLIGGFKTAGRAIFSSNIHGESYLLATGDSDESINTVQFSREGTNWIGIYDGNGIRQGGYGILVSPYDFPTVKNQVFIFGQDQEPENRTVVFSLEGFSNWSNYPGPGFNVRANGGAINSNTCNSSETLFVVGIHSAGDPTRDILQVQKANPNLPFTDPLSNLAFPFTNGFSGFSGGAFAIAVSDNFDFLSGDQSMIAVGFDSNYEYTIQYFNNGSWIQTGPFGIIGAYHVKYIGGGQWLVAAESAEKGITLLRGDGSNWTPADSGGFESIFNIGQGRAIVSQLVNQPEVLPYLQMPYLTIRQREIGFGSDPFFNDLNNQILVQNSTLALNRVLFLSSQFIGINSLPIEIPTLQEAPSLLSLDYVYASSLVLKKQYIPDNFTANEVVVSTLFQNPPGIEDPPQITGSFVERLITPYISLNRPQNFDSSQSFNRIESDGEVDIDKITLTMNVNNILLSLLERDNFTPSENDFRVGILTNEPRFQLDISGSFYSEHIQVQTTHIYSSLQISSPLSTLFTTQTFDILQGDNITTNKNTLFADSNFLSFRQVLTIENTNGFVGFSTNQAIVPLDVRTDSFFSSLSTLEMASQTLTLGFQGFSFHS